MLKFTFAAHAATTPNSECFIHAFDALVNARSGSSRLFVVVQGEQGELHIVASFDAAAAMRRFAIECAEAVLPAFAKRFPNDKRPQFAIEATKAALAAPTIKNLGAMLAANLAANDAVRDAAECDMDSATEAAMSAAEAAAACSSLDEVSCTASVGLAALENTVDDVPLALFFQRERFAGMVAAELTQQAVVSRKAA